MQFSSKHPNELVHFLNIIKWVKHWVFSLLLYITKFLLPPQITYDSYPNISEELGILVLTLKKKVGSRKNLTGFLKHWVNLQLSEFNRQTFWKWKDKLLKIGSYFVLPLFWTERGGRWGPRRVVVLARCPRVCARPLFPRRCTEFSLCQQSRGRGRFFACGLRTCLPSGSSAPPTVAHVVSRVHIHYAFPKSAGFLITFLIQDPQSCHHSHPSKINPN